MVKYSIMKKWILFISTLLFTGILFSCASTSSEEAKANSKNQQEITIAVPEEPQITPEELFLDSIKNVKIQFTSAPAKTRKGKAFTSPYEILVTDADGQPCAGFALSLKVPVHKEGTQLIFTDIDITTGEDGKVAYMPETPSFAANTVVQAYPAIPEELELTPQELTDFTETATFAVESDIATRGAIMFVFEYNENGKSPKNSYDILSGLRKKGVYTIGNAPISDVSYIDASKEKIYRENYAYVGTDYGYLIGGTVKFVNPVEKNEDGTYTAKMTAYIYGIEMKSGKVILEETKEYAGTGANWNKAVDNCRTILTSMVVDSIMFGL